MLTRNPTCSQSSGLTNSTARQSDNVVCKDWRVDTSGFRIFGECGYVGDPNFGTIEFDWAKNVMKLQIRVGR